ncbi:hypothetical protein OIU34_13595 [Pararhizobium sp. BT-229]|uniref:hypothetical protein n=1 Tax=Pararhizobium sp. BT-229 TaxID=2986923 RepID=UPI0021F7CB19|nr:hypothetical protein [Pararhizobium sp. BT-229]MCV9962938.1 hypothetical protein [Pararhizobium sp. BT-229]
MSKPLNPYVILLLAIILPGAGHVAVGEPRRGLAFALFVLLFSILTYMTTTPEHSFIGRHAGGLFIWAISIPDAYRRARLRVSVRV